MMSRAWPLLLLCLLLGCPTDTGDDDVWVPDDDDDASADDDDATGDDDDSGDDDDDDSAPELCDPADVVGQACKLVTATALSVGSTLDGCPTGQYVFEDQGAWTAFLSSCGGVADPIVSNDWATTAVAGFVDAGTGCDAEAQVLWVAHCGGRYHIGEAFQACGDCEAEIQKAAFVTLPRTALPFNSREACVPDSMACD